MADVYCDFLRTHVVPFRERADGHQSLLRDLYHLMTQTSGLSAPTASIRAGDESPELQSFLNEHGLWNP
jgi:hypothetical protein